MNDVNLPANFLLTKLCHDVTGPISAINQGLELLEDADAAMRQEAMKLVAQSAQQAAIRLQFYRLMYGHVPADGEVSLHDKKQLIDDFFAPLRITIDWTKLSRQPVSYPLLRLHVNLLLVASEVMLRGGQMLLASGDDGGFEILAQAVQLKLPPELPDVLSGQGQADPFSAKTAQHALLMALAGRLGAALGAQAEGDSGCRFTCRV